MKIQTTMPNRLKPFFREELKIAHNYFLNTDFRTSWYHLERAHILGQPYPYHHTLVHWRMLLFGIKIKDLREIIGQIPRLIVGGVKSLLEKFRWVIQAEQIGRPLKVWRFPPN